MPNGYPILADAIVILHAAYVAFVVFGLVAILLVAAIALVCVESIVGVICPLTSLENSMRQRAGATRYPDDFVAYWAHRAIFYNFPPWIFTIAYISFAILVAITFIAIPPQKPSRTTHSF